jgi:hypothetical protein
VPRTHRSAIADRVAWGETEVETSPSVRGPLERLLGSLRSIDAESGLFVLAGRRVSARGLFVRALVFAAALAGC